MAEKENVQLKKASEKLDKMNLTESERELYEARELGLYFQQIGLANAEEHGYIKRKINNLSFIYPIYEYCKYR